VGEWVDVASTAEIGPESWRTVDVDGTDIAVFNVNGEYYAIEDMCTHDGEILSGGTVTGKEITCPRHGARFSLITGEVLGPPAYEPVRTFAVRVKDGMVQVKDDRRA
jgi:3-phenylpropionate/trans-cinnamate dioxygenase ferredoxin component